MKKIFSVMLVLMTVLFLTCCEQKEQKTETKEITESTQKNSTLMIYMVGSDLETRGGAGTDDLMEIENSGIDLSCTDVLVYAAGTPYWHNEIADGECNNILKLTENGFECVEQTDSVSMCIPETLRYFLEYAHNATDSKEYALIMWNHGAGPVIGHGKDIVYDGDNLTLPEMKQALEVSPFGKENKLSWVGFDACLMASAELACLWSDYAHYMISSQETEPAFGWNYSFLSDFGKVSGDEFYKNLINLYETSCVEYYEKKGYDNREITLSCVDLSYADELETAVNGLFEAAKEDLPSAYNELARKRVETRAFARTKNFEYDLVDLKDMTDKLSEAYPEQTSALSGIIDKMVVSSTNVADDSCGISLYYPYYNKYFFENGWQETYDEIGAFEEYSEYLDTYSKEWLEKEAAEQSSLLSNASLISSAEGKYTLTLSEEENKNFAEAKYYILERTGRQLYTPILTSKSVKNENGVLTTNFDGRTIAAYTGVGLFYPVIEERQTVGDYTHYSIETIILSKFYNYRELFQFDLGIDDIFDDEYDSEQEGEIEEEQEPEQEPQEQETEYDTDDDIAHFRMEFVRNNRTGEFKQSSFVPVYEKDLGDVVMRGKAEEVDISQWHDYNFPSIPSRYITRDENGKILPFDKWTEVEWRHGLKIPINAGLEFGYQTLYNTESVDYYLVFEVIDVYGRSFFSELYPVNQDLEKMPIYVYPEPQTYEFDWETGDSCRIIDDNGIEVDMLIKPAIYRENYLEYSFAVNNKTDTNLDFVFSNFKLDGKIVPQSGYSSILVDAGEYVLEEYGFDFETERHAGVFDGIESITFDVEIRRNDNDYEYLPTRRIKINLSEESHINNDEAGYDSFVPEEPVFGAFAEEQVLYELEDFRVTLLGFGKKSETDSEEYDWDWEECKDIAFFRIDNLSDEDISICLSSSAVNGITDAYTSGDLYIPKGCSVYADYYSFPDFINEEYGVSSFDVAVSYVDKYSETVWCPVKLSQKAENSVGFEEGKDIIYNEDGIRMAVKSYDAAAKTWLITVVNDTDKSISINSMNEHIDGAPYDSSYMYDETVGPRQMKEFYTSSLSYDEKLLSEVTFDLFITNFARDEVYVYRNEPITLKAE